MINIKSKNYLKATLTFSLLWAVIILFGSLYQENSDSSIWTSITSREENEKIPIPEGLVRAGAVTPRVRQPSPKSLGGLGEAVNIDEKKLSEEKKKKYYDGFKQHAFNVYASDRISVHRTLPDVRDAECNDMKYPISKLPDTSVIICFHNEAWSTLVRTVHSVLDRSPPHLIREIILIDDFSDDIHFKEGLVDYMKLNNLFKVTVVRTEKREGLIRARLLGSVQAIGTVLTFLDSHSEVTMGWLEPLLFRIHQNQSNVVVPVVDIIDDVTFAYVHDTTKHMGVGGFDWNLLFQWHSLPKDEQERRSSDVSPVRSPTMPGGIFAIHRDYFRYLGTYDKGMDIWGGENLELSFRIWMCGGRLEILPCSRVGHIFRKHNPYFAKEESQMLRRNLIRLAEVWMDDYKQYFYERIHNNLGDFGDISDRVALRQQLKCQSFDWYVKNIYPELFVPGNALARGPIVNQADQTKCLTAKVDNPDQEHNPILISECRSGTVLQTWLLSRNNEIRRDDGCFDYSGGKTVDIYRCHSQRGNQQFEYLNNGLIWHVGRNVCLQLSNIGDALSLETCDSKNMYQRWNWQRHQITTPKRGKISFDKK